MAQLQLGERFRELCTRAGIEVRVTGTAGGPGRRYPRVRLSRIISEGGNSGSQSPGPRTVPATGLNNLN